MSLVFADNEIQRLCSEQNSKSISVTVKGGLLVLEYKTYS